MKKLIIIIMLCTPMFANADMIMFLKKSATGGSSATDYTSDTNARAAYYMNSSASESDQTTYGANLTENGSVPTSTSVPSSYSGDSRDFPGTLGDNLYQADGGSTDIYGADQAISVCLWFNADNFSAERTLASKGRISDSESWRFFLENATNTLEVAVSSDGTTTVKCQGGTALSASTWYHGCFVYDNTDVRIYLNGSLDSNGAANPLTYSAGLNNSGEPFYLGRSAAQYFLGLMDEVIVFNDALTSTEVSEIYTSGIDGGKGGSD